VLATCAEQPGLDEEGLLLQAALEERGVLAVPVPWTDARYPWETALVVLPRTTWDYCRHLRRFTAWASGLGTRLVNPPAMVRWNADKRYLRDLAHDGIPVVATRFIQPGQRYDLPGEPCVVKPTVAAGANGAAYHTEVASARRHITALHVAGRTAMVQPYVDTVNHDGETEVVFLGGRVSHGLRKAAMLAPGQQPSTATWRDDENVGPGPVRLDMLQAARAAHEAVAARFGTAPLYARVDLLRGPDNQVLVAELELIECSLGLQHAPGSAGLFAGVIARQFPRLTFRR
jgi:glutathione synthase/RimK-type ligase-like ATP-grasp enzyme